MRPAFEAMVAKLRERFRIGRVCVVADRGMIARDILASLTGHQTPWDYILGCRLRGDKEVRDCSATIKVRAWRQSSENPVAGLECREGVARPEFQAGDGSVFWGVYPVFAVGRVFR